MIRNVSFEYKRVTTLIDTASNGKPNTTGTSGKRVNNVYITDILILLLWPLRQLIFSRVPKNLCLRSVGDIILVEKFSQWSLASEKFSQ